MLQCNAVSVKLHAASHVMTGLFSVGVLRSSEDLLFVYSFSAQCYKLLPRQKRKKH